MKVFATFLSVATVTLMGVTPALAESTTDPIVVPASGLVSAGGIFGPGFSCGSSLVPGTCMDVLAFDLSAFSAAPAVTMTFDVRSLLIGSLVPVAGLTAALVDPVPAPIAFAAGDPAIFSATVAPTSLFSDGLHRLVVIGSSPGSVDASVYSVALSVSAVPEPETYAMLLAGLGVLAFAARRRAAAG